MRYKIGAFFVCSLLLLSFCGCSEERQFDIFEFERRYESCFDEPLFDSADLFREETGNSADALTYCCTVLPNAQQKALLSLQTDKSGNVTALSLTAVKNEKPFDRTAFLSLFTRLCAIMAGQTSEVCAAELQNSRITEQQMDFSENYLAVRKDKFAYTVCSNSEILSCFVERI